MILLNKHSVIELTLSWLGAWPLNYSPSGHFDSIIIWCTVSGHCPLPSCFCSIFFIILLYDAGGFVWRPQREVEWKIMWTCHVHARLFRVVAHVPMRVAYGQHVGIHTKNEFPQSIRPFWSFSWPHLLLTHRQICQILTVALYSTDDNKSCDKKESSLYSACCQISQILILIQLTE